MNFGASGNVKSIHVEATIIRADGRIEPLGVIARWHKNPLIRLWYKIIGALNGSSSHKRR